MIEASKIAKRFGNISVLKNINLQVEDKEIVAILGASGAGKTTLLQILGTLEKPDEGEIFIDGVNVRKLNEKKLSALRNEKIGFVFQFHQLLPAFTALENVMLPALIKGISERKATQRAKELLELVQLNERLNHKPSALSGGEKQRVAIARALVNSPKIVLADEPSGSLDTENKTLLHNLFFTLRKELGQSFLIVTHDEEFAKQADRTLYIRDGEIFLPNLLDNSKLNTTFAGG